MTFNIENVFVEDLLYGSLPKYQIATEDEVFLLDKIKCIEVKSQNNSEMIFEGSGFEIEVPLHEVSEIFNTKSKLLDKEIKEIIYQFWLDVRPFLNQKILLNNNELDYCLNSICDGYVICHPDFSTDLIKYKNIRFISFSGLEKNEFIITHEPEFTGVFCFDDIKKSFGLFIVKKYCTRVQFIR